MFPHHIGMVRTVHATFTQNFHVELSQEAKWLQGKMGAEVWHSGNQVIYCFGRKAAYPLWTHLKEAPTILKKAGTP